VAPSDVVEEKQQHVIIIIIIIIIIWNLYSAYYKKEYATAKNKN